MLIAGNALTGVWMSAHAGEDHDKIEFIPTTATDAEAPVFKFRQRVLKPTFNSPNFAPAGLKTFAARFGTAKIAPHVPVCVSTPDAHADPEVPVGGDELGDETVLDESVVKRRRVFGGACCDGADHTRTCDDPPRDDGGDHVTSPIQHSFTVTVVVGSAFKEGAKLGEDVSASHGAWAEVDGAHLMRGLGPLHVQPVLTFTLTLGNGAVEPVLTLTAGEGDHGRQWTKRPHGPHTLVGVWERVGADGRPSGVEKHFLHGGHVMHIDPAAQSGCGVPAAVLYTLEPTPNASVYRLMEGHTLPEAREVAVLADRAPEVMAPRLYWVTGALHCCDIEFHRFEGKRLVEYRQQPVTVHGLEEPTGSTQSDVVGEGCVWRRVL